MTGRNRAARTALAAMLAVVGSAAAGAADYPANLPPDAVVRAVLNTSPAIVAARESVIQGNARQRRLASGPHEWQASVISQRRTDVVGLAYNEQEYELSRAWRIPGKAALDRQMGRQAANNGTYAFADEWHESGRLLLALWFEWQRASVRARSQSGQSELLRQQSAAVARRVAAGDAPRIDQQLAEAELGRAAVAQLEAARQAELARLQLSQNFPDLQVSAADMIGTPQPPEGSDEEWVLRILGENHEIELAEGRAAVARLNATRVGRDRLADPTLGLVYSNNLDGNREVLGLRFSLPLGGSARRADYATARSAATIADSEARIARLKVEGDARRDVLNVRNTYLQWQRMADVAEQSARNADIMARGYDRGEFGISELLATRRTTMDSRLTADDAQLTVLEAHARLLLDSHQLWVLDEGADSDAK